MKIFHIITSLKIGGAESALNNFLRLANHNPHEHSVAYFHPGPNVDRLHELGIRTHHIKGCIFYADPLALWRLAKLIKKTRPDVIHTALWSANIIGRLMARWFGLPVITDVHGNSFDEGKFRNWFDRKTVGYATGIVAVSTSAHDAYAQNILRTSAKNSPPLLITINNGIDCHAVCAKAYQEPLTRAALNLRDDNFVVGAVGRLELIKSYDILIKACAHCITTYPALRQNLKLVIVGGGSQEQELNHLTATLGITNNVILVGAQTNALKFYPLFDCFALSSQSEGLSIALLEALCFGLPIITTNATTKHDVIKPGINGFLVPPNNVPALAQAIKHLLENNSQRAAMYHANKKLVENNFSLAAAVTAYHTMYEKVAIKSNLCL